MSIKKKLFGNVNCIDLLLHELLAWLHTYFFKYIYIKLVFNTIRMLIHYLFLKVLTTRETVPLHYLWNGKACNYFQLWSRNEVDGQLLANARFPVFFFVIFFFAWFCLTDLILVKLFIEHLTSILDIGFV